MNKVIRLLKILAMAEHGEIDFKNFFKASKGKGTKAFSVTGFQIAICDSRFATHLQVFTNHFSQKTKEIAIQKAKQVQI